MFSVRQSKFDSLVRAYSTELYRFAYWLCRNPHTAEDVVQETFARAWQAIDELREDKAAKSWLYTILRHEYARLFRRKPLDIDHDQPLDELVGPAAADPARQVEFDDAVKTLPDAYREPLLLQWIGGYSCKEIAEIMSLTEGAVMTRLTRARIALGRLDGTAPRAKKQVLR